MRREQGLTLTGFMITAVIVVFILLFAFKIGPVYFEYFSLQKQLKALASDPVARSPNRRELEAAYTSRATVENITAIGAGDISITKNGDEVELSAEYSKKVPLFGNLSACMDFTATTASK